MNTDWNTYARFGPKPPGEGPATRAEAAPAADVIAAENPIGVTPEQCERHRLAYLRALLAEVRGRGR